MILMINSQVGMAKQKNPKRVAAAKRNPWIKHIKKSCAPRYRDKVRVRQKKSRKRQRSLRQMVEPPKRKRKRIVVQDEPDLVDVTRRKSGRKIKKRRFLRDEQ